MSKTSSIIVNVGLIAATGVGVYALTVSLWYSIAYSTVIPLSGTSLDAWVDAFMIAAITGHWVTIGLVAAWYTLGEWIWKVLSWQQGGKRIIWSIFGLLAVIACLGIGFFMTERTQAGGELAWLAYVVNPILMYYGSTLLFSPNAFKYTAPLSRLVRRW